MMSSRLFALTTLTILVASATLAGCLELPDEGNEAPSTGQYAGDTRGRLLSVLDALPAPGYDRALGAQWWEDFVNENHYRLWALPVNQRAAAYLESELADAGFEADTLTFNDGPQGVSPPVGPEPPTEYMVVRGIKKGTTNPDHRLLLISHFDTVPQTAQGAYDDGSGVAAEMQICKLLAKVETNKTIECAFFDGEEQGLVASQAYAQQYRSNHENATIDYVYDQGFGYDMTGLNWPGYSTWKLYAMVGTQHKDLAEFTEAHQEFMNITLYEFLGGELAVTREGVETIPIHDRNSDEQNFKRVGLPVIRFAGGRKAADYPMYHQAGDTVPYVYSYACGMCTDQAKGKELFAKGFEMVILASYYTILAWDQFDPKTVDLEPPTEQV
jgi:hypothetical protein